MNRSIVWIPALTGVLLGCAALEPATQLQRGQSEAEIVQRMGAPTGRHALPSGATRLEFARGPAGRTTWMVDLDPGGRLSSAEQVLHAGHFAQVSDGMTGAELLRLLGRPAERAGEWQNRQTWSWRYVTNDCLWFRVTLSADGRTLGGGSHMPDPSCDARDNARE